MKALLAIATASIPLLFDWIPRHTITADQYINVTTQPKELCSFLRLLVSVCLLCSLSLSLSFCKTSEASDYPPAPKHGNFLQVLQERSHIPRVEGFPSEWPTSSRVHQVRGPVRFQKRYKQLVHQWQITKNKSGNLRKPKATAQAILLTFCTNMLHVLFGSCFFTPSFSSPCFSLLPSSIFLSLSHTLSFFHLGTGSRCDSQALGTPNPQCMLSFGAPHSLSLSQSVSQSVCLSVCLSVSLSLSLLFACLHGV